MASHHKKESEGIALLSIYGDEDDEMEEMGSEDEDKPQDQQQEQLQQIQQEEEKELFIEENPSTIIIQENISIISRVSASEFPGSENTSPFVREEQQQQQQQVVYDNFTPGRVVGGLRSASGTPRDSLSSPAPAPPQQLLVLERRRKERIMIVDYGHDEVAMSPEPEEGEIMVSGQIMEAENNGDFEEKTVQVLTPCDRGTPPQVSDPNDQAETDTINHAVNEPESAEAEDAVMLTAEEPTDIDLLNKFLPPPPKVKCSDELQERIVKFLSLKKTRGRSYNAEVRNRKEYRNPDFLRHAVTYQDIDELGSCFSKEVFDPHGYDKSDFYDELEADMRREMERKEQERKRSPKIDFLSGGSQPGTVPTSKIGLPIPGFSFPPGSGLNTLTVALDTVARDGRHSKKSKWDKVDGDRKNLLPIGGQDSVSAVAEHAAGLSAANAGSGYSAYAQQRRREAEDKRSSSDKKSDRRT